LSNPKIKALLGLISIGVQKDKDERRGTPASVHFLRTSERHAAKLVDPVRLLETMAVL